jgi:hypothetical protein
VVGLGSDNVKTVTAYSTDGGVNWTAGGDFPSGSSPGTNIAYGGQAGSERLVTTTSDGDIIYSSDRSGTSWTKIQTRPSNSGKYGIIWDGGKFVLWGSGGKILTSTTGTSWTEQSGAGIGFSASEDGKGLVYTGSTFVAVGGYEKLATSTDGINWTNRNAQFDFDIIRTGGDVIAWGGGTFVTAGNSGNTAYSADGITWKAGGKTPREKHNFAIAYGSNRFVALSTSQSGLDAEQVIAYSKDF